ncbi:hypothetical protein CYMTET_56648 [Cymbomonas tetramitiformis]|uniref:Rubisco LSMT substrate-binding domain-containing protein n=1 Tax=Cymbomonas tetramitiformis TaxID=36881 RepID=A0AAE0EMC8_9CHLO|nr:hypothetical protein CYMTET_56648 [Cymbomonas tetramitiformis]
MSRRCRLAATASGVQSPAAVVGNLTAWMTEKGAVTQVAFDGEDWRVEGSDKINTSEALVRIPEKLAITTYDVREHDLIAEVAEGRDDFVGLTLWVLAELAKGPNSSWSEYLTSLPAERSGGALSPIFWTPEERAELLKGSPVLELAEQRSAAMDAEYAALEEGLQKALADYPPAAYSQEAFRRAFGMVLARVTYLPSAGVLALIPLADSLPLTSGSGAVLDYDVETGEVMVYADRAYGPGEKVEITDTQTRPNSELMLCRGEVDMNNVEDYMEYTVELLRIDPLYNVKKEILLASQLEETQVFPLYSDRFPQQLLCYLRLTRIQNTEELMKVRQDLLPIALFVAPFTDVHGCER